MAFLHGKNTAVLFNEHDLSSYFNDASVTRSIETAETTAFGGSAKTYIVGLNDGTISLTGMFDGSADAVDQVLDGVLAAEDGAVVTVFFDGTSGGNRVAMGQVEETSYDISAPVGDVVAASAELQGDGGIDMGLALNDLNSNTSTGFWATYNNGSSTANGGQAIMHTTVNTRDGASTLKVQHSADNSTWVDLVTFTDVGAGTTTSERVVVAAGTTVNQYLRASHTLAGSSGGITYIISFARR